MEVLLSKFIEDPDQSLEYISGHSIQLAFYKRKTFRFFNHKEFKRKLQALDIRVASVHAPAADIYHTTNDEFINMLKLIKEEYNVSVLTLHPQRGERRQAKSHFKKLARQIKELGIVLAYETFEGEDVKKKWIYQLEDMHQYFNLLNHPFLGITYDFAHASKERAIEEVRKFKDKIKIIHFSDALSRMPEESEEHHQHLPLGQGEYPVLEFLDMLIEIDYKGYLILEYWDQYHHLLKEDYRALTEYIGGNKEPFLKIWETRRDTVALKLGAFQG